MLKREIFEIWGVNEASDEQKMRFRFSLDSAYAAILNEMADDKARQVIDDFFKYEDPCF